LKRREIRLRKTFRPKDTTAHQSIISHTVLVSDLQLLNLKMLYLATSFHEMPVFDAQNVKERRMELPPTHPLPRPPTAGSHPPAGRRHPVCAYPNPSPLLWIPFPQLHSSLPPFGMGRFLPRFATSSACPWQAAAAHRRRLRARNARSARPRGGSAPCSLDSASWSCCFCGPEGDLR
jgi:hypothetical protein